MIRELGVRFYTNGAEVCIAQVSFLENFTIRTFSMRTGCERHTSFSFSFSHGACHIIPLAKTNIFSDFKRKLRFHMPSQKLCTLQAFAHGAGRSILISNPLKGDRIVDISLAGRRYSTLLDMLLVALVTALSELE